MATAAPHVKLLRQLASAKDDYLSGAFDISWDGAKATLYLVFGRPSHAVFDTDQAQIEGEAAIDALLAELPRTFVVSDWRRAMSPQETLSISIDELAGPFVRLAGSYADDPIADENPEWWSADDSSPDLAFGLADFPLLPGGRPLWAETSPENVNLAERLAELPPSILILTGAKLRAAAVVSGGDMIDAVWIDDEDQARGEAAAMAILGATKGSLAGYALDDPRVADALTMLWRLPLAVSGIEMAWLDPASMLAAFRSDGLDRVLVIDAPVRGIALFSRGGLVAVYSETQRSAVASPERLRSLLSQARGRLTVMERKPRPTANGAAPSIPSAMDFFSVETPAPEAEPAVTADATPAPDTQEMPESAGPAAAALDAEPELDTSTYAEVADHTALWMQPVADAVPVAESDAAEAPAAAAASATAVHVSESAAEAPAAGAESQTGEDAPPPPPPTEAEAAATESDVPPPPAPEAATEMTSDAATEPGPEAAAEPAPEGSTEITSDAATEPGPEAAVEPAPEAAPEPAPEAASEPAPKAKRRPWWAFGTRRKSAAQAPSEEDKAAGEAVAAQSAAEAIETSGWSVRQPDANAPPVWARPRDHAFDPAVLPATGAEPPEHGETHAGETPDSEPATTWSVVEPGAPAVHWPTAPGVEGAGSVDQPVDLVHTSEVDSPAAAEPTAADASAAPEATADTSPGWAPRQGTADSLSWHLPPPAAPEPDAQVHAGEAHASVDAGDDAPAEVEHGAAAATGHDADAETGHDDDAETEHDLATGTEHEDAAETEQDATAETDDDVAAEAEHDDAADTDHDVAAETEHDAAEPEQDAAAEGDHAVAAETEPVAAADDEHEHHHEADLHPVGADHVESATARDFWAEFAAPDPDADSEDATHEPAATSAGDAAPDADGESEPQPEATPEPDHDAATAEGTEPPKRKSSERTFAPWSWPLAEAETPVVPTTPGTRMSSFFDEPDEHATPVAEPVSAAHAAEPDSGATEHGFFQRDEPVGSQFVDFDEVRKELVQIGVVWLGERNAVPVTALLTKTRSTIDDFVATIDTIRGLHVEGQDPASIQAMAREMHQQAAERLCGA